MKRRAGPMTSLEISGCGGFSDDLEALREVERMTARAPRGQELLDRATLN
jgi:hypothetical protein